MQMLSKWVEVVRERPDVFRRTYWSCLYSTDTIPFYVYNIVEH